MVCTRLGISALVAAAALTAGTARAADYSQPLPPQQYVIQQPPPVEEFASNWYLRGFVGAGINGKYSLDYLPAPANVGNGFVFREHSIADTMFIGGAVGYEWNNWLRFDFSGEYRAKSRVYAFGTYSPNGLDTYEGNLNSWVFLANTFVDLGTWNCFTPFVGFGVGGARVTLADFSDVNPTGGYGFGRNPTKWNFAWALHAGVAYNVSKNLKVELAYRYLNYGSITDTVDCAGGCNSDSFKFDHLYSHDIMLGLRWTCCESAPAPRYVYTPPPPVYMPPLHSKG
ncbi:MAG TPA: outer membrane beta-barrel protein [Pseudolabrys sp.]|jgi:opacity protein-like surface antigen|nr:outer membrane beta-barrel protein [Pseudolabrys sp.]